MMRPSAPVPGRQPYPWQVPDLFRWFALLGLSVVGIVVAWWCASGSATFSRQLTWLNVGVAAVVVAGLGNMTWLLQGRRALVLRRRLVLSALGIESDPTDLSAVEADDVRHAGPGTTRHHRSGCPAVAGKQTETMSATDHERAGRRPCALCCG